MGRSVGIFVVACVCGVAAGMFGVGGGVLLVPLLGLLFAFEQHRAQGTSLIALIPPTGVLALLAYSKEGFVSWKTGLLLIPGVFLGGTAGGKVANGSSRGRCARFLREFYSRSARCKLSVPGGTKDGSFEWSICTVTFCPVSMMAPPPSKNLS